jgi:hypothetical protein
MGARLFSAALMRTLLLTALAAGALLTGCSEGTKLDAGSPSTRSAVGGATYPVRGASRSVAFAALPDAGELLAYESSGTGKRRGAYTWHPVNLSEEHALRAIATGEMHVRTPAGKPVTLAYERHIEHPDGNWTWIGRTADGQEALLTFGEQAAFGSIPNGNDLPLRLTMSAGRSWIVESDRSRISGLDTSATRPRKTDTLLPPIARRASSAQAMTASGKGTSLQSAIGVASTAPVVDVALGYTTGFTNEHGGQSQAVTRLNYLVEVANSAMANSQIAGRIRLVRTVQVNYPDATDNTIALEELTGYRDGDEIPVPAALKPLRDAREASGADLVSLVRAFRAPENDGCGIAWLLGFGQRTIDQSWADFGYSIVSDGSDYDETESGTYFCRDETLGHELGHNMGSAHDRETSEGDDAVLDPDDYGRYPYSFGYKNNTTNFYTVMAYGDSGQTLYRIFSNPRTTYCGGMACGVVDQVDNARSLAQTMPIIAQFRATGVGTFADVPTNYWAYNQIEKLFAAGITGGCSANPRLFCPAGATLRDELAVFLLRAKHGAAYQPPPATGVFTDVPTSYWAAAWIERLRAEGISGGCQSSPLRYCPGGSVTRDQMAVFLLRAKYGAGYAPPPATGVFADVPTSHWAAPWIEQLAEEGVTGGCSTQPLKFCPSSVVARDQMAVFLVRTFGL